MNNLKKNLKSKRQMQTDLASLAQSKSKHFRVFFNVLEGKVVSEPLSEEPYQQTNSSVFNPSRKDDTG